MDEPTTDLSRCARRRVARLIIATLVATSTSLAVHPVRTCVHAAGPGDARQPGLPAGMVVRTVVVGGDGVLLASGRMERTGTSPGRPAMARLVDDRWVEIPVEPSSGDGRDASLLFATADHDGTARAIGIRVGGQHLLPRYTAWVERGGRLVEQPQPFETFGGPRAGKLLGLVATNDGPRLQGSWSTAIGVGVQLWSVHGDSWQRIDHPELSGDATHQQLGGAMASDGGQLLIGGIQTVFDGTNPFSQPALWRGPPGGPFTEVDTLQRGPQTMGIVTDVACAVSSTCWAVVGSRRSGSEPMRLGLWRIGDRAEPIDGWSSPYHFGDQRPRLAAEGDTVVVADAGSDEVHVFDGIVWSAIGRPPGTIDALAVSAGVVYVVVDGSLTSISTGI